MAQLVLAAAGAGVGFLAGGPTGAQIGWAVGSAIGGFAFSKPVVQKQPLQDTSFLDSSYGNPIDVHYGTIIASRTNVFWTTEFRPIAHTSTAGGKGTPEVESTTYTYEIDLAIALSDRECAGVGRIWVDNEIVYDGRTTSGAPGVIAGGGVDIPDGVTGPISGAFRLLEAELRGWCDFAHWYPGSEDQEPDSIMEEAEGAGMVPGYRGLNYLVIKSLQCGSFPRVPQLKIEVIADGEDELRGVLWTNTNAEPNFTRRGILTVTDQSVVDYTLPFNNIIDVASTARFSYIDGTQLGAYGLFPYPSTLGTNGEDVLIFREKPIYSHPTRADITSGGNPSVYVAGLVGGVWTSVANYTSLFLDGHATFLGAIGSTDERHVLVLYRDEGGFSWQPTEFTIIDTGELDAGIETWVVADDPENPGTGWRGTVDTTAGAGNGLTRYQFSINDPTSAVGCMESDLRHVWISGQTGGDIYCWKLRYTATDGWVIGDAHPDLNPINMTGVTDGGGGDTSASIWADHGICIVATGVEKIGAVTRYMGLTGESPTVSQVLRHVYSLSGYDETEDLNVGHLTQEVLGFEFQTPATPRSGFDVMGSSYLIDFVESDGKIKGVERGGAVAADLTVDDLGATESGEFEAPLEIERQHESEIPYKVTVLYLSLEGDYKRGAQIAENAITSSNEQVTIDLPIVLEDDRAAQLADIIRRARWRARSPIKASTWIRNLKLEPTDVVTLDDGSQTRKVIITGMRQRGILLELDTMSEGGASYTSNAVGGAVMPSPQVLAPIPGTDLIVLDMVALLDSHDNYGVNAAAAGLLPTNWPGAQVYTSADDISFDAAGTITTPAVIGRITSVMGDWDDPQMFDNVNIVNVQVNGTLSSVAHDDAVEGENLAAIEGENGWEVITFRSATTFSGGYYLQGFERGRAGSEFAIGEHPIGSRFVILNLDAIRVGASSGNLAQTMYFRGVTIGRSVSTVDSQSLTFMAESLRPLSPVELFAWIIPGGDDIGLRWVRRARINAEWADLIDVPLDEDAETYEVDILDGSDVVRTVTVTDDTETIYTSAQQTIDFGAVVDVEIEFRVRQMSSRVGDGHNAQASITFP